MSVHKKLMEARIRLQNEKLSKSGHNKFAGYQYFELGDFLPTVQTIFGDLGLCGIVSYTADTASLTITDTEDGTTLAITSPMGSAALKGCHEVQNIGAVETYQRRYLWVTAMEIVEHDALDAVTGSSEPVKKVSPISGAAVKKDAFDALDPDQQRDFMSKVDQVRALLDQGNEDGGYDLYAEFRDQLEDTAHKAALRGLFSSAEQSTLTKQFNKRKKEAA